MHAAPGERQDAQAVYDMPRALRARLTRAAGRVASGRDPDALRSVRVPSAAEPALPSFLEAQGVGALCGAGSLGALPPSIIAAVDDLVVRTLARGDRLRADRLAIQGAMADAGIAFAPLKGAWVADRAYSPPSARPMADTDLLVAPEDMDRATAALARLAFRPAETTWKHRVLRRESDRHVIDGVIEHPDNPRPVELHSQSRESFRGIEGRIVPSQPGRSHARSTDIDDAGQLALIAAHATVDALGRSLRLVSIVDIARLAIVLPQSIWDEAVERMHPRRGARFLFPSLELASRELGAPIPGTTLAALRAQVTPALARWVDRQDLDGLSRLARGQVERPLLEIPRIWPLDAAERFALWRFIVWPKRLELADRYPGLAASRRWPMAYGLHAADSISQLRRRVRHRPKRPRSG